MGSTESTENITKTRFLRYELASSWLVSVVWFNWGRNILSIYFTKKVNKKYINYLKYVTYLNGKD